MSRPFQLEKPDLHLDRLLGDQPLGRLRHAFEALSDAGSLVVVLRGEVQMPICILRLCRCDLDALEDGEEASVNILGTTTSLAHQEGIDKCLALDYGECLSGPSGFCRRCIPTPLVPYQGRLLRRRGRCHGKDMLVWFSSSWRRAV